MFSNTLRGESQPLSSVELASEITSHFSSGQSPNACQGGGWAKLMCRKYVDPFPCIPFSCLLSFSLEIKL